MTYRPEDGPSEDSKLSSDEAEPPPPDDVAVSSVEVPPVPTPVVAQNNVDTGDLLGLDYAGPDASAIEESNALALAIVPTESGTAPTFNSGAAQARDFDPTGWELALVTTPSSDISAANERKLAGGLDSLTLNSLYDEGAYRASQQPVYGAPAPNPFEVNDPFAVSNNFSAAPAVQMAGMAPQPPNPFGPYQPSYPPPPQQQNVMMNPANPFGDPGFGAFPAHPVAHQQTNNPFGSTGLL